jgi:hypothetical protein
MQNFTETTNGAISLKTTGNYIVDYFMMYNRGLEKNINSNFLEKCWNINPEKTIAIIFNGRDRMSGKKEKKVSNEAMMWLRMNKPKTYTANIKTYVDNYGCWKDLLYISYHNKKNLCDNTIIKDKHELYMFADQLKTDIFQLNYEDKPSVSLCAKWAPSENDRNDRRMQFAKKLAKILYSKDEPKMMEKYRKEYIVPLRKRINIVENLICNNEWDKIKYETVPGVASKRLLNAFMKHDKDRYTKYLESVRKGEKEIKITGLLPHELARHYINDKELNSPNETIELQWRAILENIRAEGVLDNALAIIDASGSMFNAKNGSIPAQVAIALGIITSLCSKGSFYKRFITFSHDPEMHELDNEILYDAYKKIMNMDYGYNTDFKKCCDCIIQYGILKSIPDDKMPKKIFVFTDMQFDNASISCESIETTYQHISKMFTSNGYTSPKFIFWNLNSDHNETFPVDCSIENTAMVSGFSEQLLKIFMKYDNFDPNYIVDEILEPYIKNIIIDDDER